MTELVEHKNVDEAINAIMQEVGYVQKQSSRELRYTYASEAAFIEALRPAMVKHGVYAKVQAVKKVYRSTYETKNGTNMFNTLIEGVVRFTHVSGTFSDCEATGEGSDTGDKSANKAMTGLYKYGLRQTFCIETGDDPDQFSSDQMERGTSKPARAAAQVSTGVKVAATMPLDDHQKGANAPESQKSGNGASEQPGASGAVSLAEELAESYTGNQILGSKDGTLVKEIVELSGKPTPLVCGYVAKLEKGKKFSIGQIVKALTEEKS
jgi:hypothetical protein